MADELRILDQSFAIDVYGRRILRIKNDLIGTHPELVRARTAQVPEEFFRRPLRTLNIVATNRCNLACQYCFSAGLHDGQHFDADMIPSVSRFIETMVPNAIVRFIGGGEPLLNWEFIRDLIGYVGDRSGAGTRWRITTNGTLLSTSVREFVSTIGIPMKISIDGNAAAAIDMRYSGNRRVHRTVMRNIEYLLERVGVITAAGAVVSARTGGFYQVFEQLYEIGFRYIRLQCIIDERFTPARSEWGTFFSELHDLADHYLAMLTAGSELVIDNFDIAIRQVHAFLTGANLSVCHAGVSDVSVYPDGRIYPCVSLTDGTMQIGSLREGLFPDRIQTIQTIRGTPERCSHCWAVAFCRGGCRFANSVYEGQTSVPSSFYCEYIRAVISAGIWLYDRLARSHMGVLRAVLARELY